MTPNIGRWINADGFVSTGQGLLGYNMYAYCRNNPIVNVDPTGLCDYNGTMADFIRLNQGLPPMDCVCKIKKALENTEIVVNVEDGKVNAQITVSLEETSELLDVGYSQLSEYTRWVDKRLEYYSSISDVLDENQKKQLFGEILVHILGWESRAMHNFDDNCRVINLDIVDGGLDDPRTWVDAASINLGGQYYVEE